MALSGPFTGLPKPPKRTASGAADPLELARWFDKLWQILSGIPGIAWAIVDKTGSSLADLTLRPFSALQMANRSKDADYTMLSTDTVIFVDTTSGDVTITLPNAATYTSWANIRQDAGNNSTIVAAAGSDTVEGSASFTIGLDESLTLDAKGTTWRVI